jgi:hypothetical protein
MPISWFLTGCPAFPAGGIAIEVLLIRAPVTKQTAVAALLLLLFIIRIDIKICNQITEYYSYKEADSLVAITQR